MIYIDFNPRSHERSDQGEESITQDIKISIHAPTRGATCAGIKTDTATKFQSTLPREERPLISGSTTASKNFNPRSHERSDDFDGCRC